MTVDVKTEVKPVVPGSPEHEAAMIALAEKSNVRIRVSDATSGQSQFLDMAPAKVETTAAITPEQKPVRPDNVPEKFWNAEKGVVNTEALLKSYGEAETALSKAAATKAAAPVVPEKTAEQKTAEAALAAATTDEAKATAKTALDAANTAAATAAAAAAAAKAAEVPVTPVLVTAMNAAANDFAKDGAVSEESFVALEKAGITRDYAQQYVDGLKASAQLVELQVYNEAGGKDEFTKMSQWASTNVSADQLEAYNKAVLSGKLEATLGAIKTLKQLYTAAHGSAPRQRVEPDNGGAPKGDMFRSQLEVTTAMNDPRYVKGDKAFHAEVDRKLDASIKAGINLGF